MEFRKMRRSKQELPLEDCLAVIKRGTSGVLSVLGDSGYPYGVPLSYVFVPGGEDAVFSSKGDPSVNGPYGVFYFHSAVEGHKIDAVKACDKACFTIIDRDDVVADEFTTYFKSVICFGRASVLEDPEEIMSSIKMLAERYSPDQSEESVKAEIDKSMPHLAMIRFDVEHMTGKKAIELVK